MPNKKNTKPIPPDPENMNADRAGWAEAAIREFTKQTGADEEDAVCDLLADLMHWCDRNGQDFSAELERARMHYSEETMRSDDDPEPEEAIDPVQAAKHYMEKSGDPGHGESSTCEVCRFHLVHG